MKRVILKANDISKQYRLGLVGTGTMADDFKRFLYRIAGKEDPYLKIGAENNRSAKASEKYVWALKDINFEVREGEVLGIIGKNGAGKSTLLKILSRVTSPTTGVIKTGGRIASLLEVGTGFHPELTGKENIFLNGAILGMNKAEISSKLEEIISFSGCEMYIDTPVKRYSSGMRVRLAFAVAAHLEPDILVVDEVLAVGDAEFQKKAIGKMQDISKGDGRTVLFVSHNMAAVKSLCTRGIVLEHGKIAFEGDVDKSVSFYLSNTTDGDGVLAKREDRQGSGHVKITDAYFEDAMHNKIGDLISGERVFLKLEYEKESDFDASNLFLGLTFFDSMGVKRTVVASDELGIDLSLTEERGIIEFEFPQLLFRSGSYQFNLYLGQDRRDTNKRNVLDSVEKALVFNVEPGDFWNTGKLNRPEGYVQPVQLKF